MRCTCPIDIQNKATGAWYTVPCGQCTACRLNKVRDWTLRLMHEAKFYDKMCFLTITYDEEHLPEGRTLVKKHLQDYLKRIRYYCGHVRFFACGEYGDQYSRPHYHIVMFGIDKDNQIFKGKKYDVKHGIWYVKSPAWLFGTTYIGEVTYNSCRYVASYVQKKIFGKGSADWYKRRGVIPEFTLMSRKPGIGADFVDFTNPSLFENQLSFGKVGSWDCQDIMKTECSTPLNFTERDKLKSLSILEELTRVTMKCNNAKQIINQNLERKRGTLNKFLKSLKEIIYWLTLIMPVIDGAKTVCKCISLGIEAGKADLQKAKEQAEAERFLDINNGNSIGLEEFFNDRKDK